MRGLDMALGLESRVAFDLGDVLDGVCELRQALVRGPDGLRLLAARQMRDTEELDEDALGRVMDALRAQFDWVLVDTAGGVGRGFTAAARCGLEALAVTTPDDASLRCVERAAGLWQRLGGEPPMLCVNRIRPALAEEGPAIHTADVRAGGRSASAGRGAGGCGGASRRATQNAARRGFPRRARRGKPAGAP